MTDKTTMGITAEPEEVEAVLLNLCGYHLSESDPVFRYTVLTREQVLYDALVTAIKRERGRALAELVEKGHKLTEIAELTGLGSRQRVQRLMQLAKVEQAVADVQAASRHFDERLAAVEATLDEVVSGLTPVVTDAVIAEFDRAGSEKAGSERAGSERDPHATQVLAQVNEAFDEVVLNEPTQLVPTLAAVLHAAAVNDRQVEETPWWRRSRDTGAA